MSAITYTVIVFISCVGHRFVFGVAPPHATLASRPPATTLPGSDLHRLIAPALPGAFTHSITSPARASSGKGSMMPSAFAVLRFIISNFRWPLLTTARLSSFSCGTLIGWITALRQRPEFDVLCAPDNPHTAGMPPRLTSRDELFRPRP